MRAGAVQRAVVRGLASRLAALDPTSKAQISLVGFTAGALHALDRAAQLNFEDARGQPVPAQFAREFKTTLNAISRGRGRPNAWLAGFYLHSAMLRLAAVNERLNTLVRTRDDRARSVRRAVNSLKHHVDAHISGKRTVPFAEVLRAAQIVCKRLEQAVP
jgi:hypothetical protein